MTLKSIVRAISNDKVLSILALFSVILIGTLLYYNLSARLLNNNSRTLENFQDNNENDICEYIRELEDRKSNENQENFETYDMKDATGTTYEVLIIDKEAKEEQIMTYIKTYLTNYVNELISSFNFDIIGRQLTDNMSFSDIEDIIVVYMSNTNQDILRSTIDEYKENIENAISTYHNQKNTNTDGTVAFRTDYYKHLYITTIYKIILKIMFKNKINKTKVALDSRITKALDATPGSALFESRKRRVRQIVNVLHRLNMSLKFISDDVNFESKIKYNLLSDYEINSETGEPEVTMSITNNSGKNVLELSDTFNDDEDSRLSLYIKDNDTTFKNMISDFGIEDNLKEIYNTSDVGYFHVFDKSWSIMHRYTKDEYDTCYETIELESASV